MALKKKRRPNSGSYFWTALIFRFVLALDFHQSQFYHHPIESNIGLWVTLLLTQLEIIFEDKIKRIERRNH